MLTLENDIISISINETGAELRSIRDNRFGEEYLWQANPAFWNKTSPLLFPIVGKLKNDKYLREGKEYELCGHGFAQKLLFKKHQTADNSAYFEASSTRETLKSYPFNFELRVTYTLMLSSVKIAWSVKNKDDKPMLFSIGAHPAFVLPQNKNDDYDNCTLEFEGKETGKRTPLKSYTFIPDTGLINREKKAITKGSLLALTKGLFREHSVLIFERIDSVTLRRGNKPSIQVSFPGFPYLGLWSAIDKSNEVAPFVCIEPWFGLADFDDRQDCELGNKDGIRIINPNKSFSSEYKIALLI